jgi:ATP-dependent DNA helicase RecG
MCLYDEVTVEGTTLDDMDQGVFTAYLRRYHDPTWLETLTMEQLAVNMKLARREGDRPELTIAGLLLFGRDPQRHLPYSGISAISFRGSEVGESEILLSKEIQGRLDQQIEDSALFVERNTFVTSELKDWRREDHPQ